MSTKFLDTALNLTTQIEEKANTQAEISGQFDAKKLEIIGYEASLMQEVTSEMVEETGKPRYSNDAARNAALVAKKADSEFLKNANIALSDLSLKKAKVANEINRLNSQVSLYRAYLHGGNEVFNMLAEGVKEVEAAVTA